jgi:hypothetical protein
MAATRHQELIGRYTLVAFRTTHFDRAGETGVQVVKHGEIVAVEAPGLVVIDAEEGEHLRFPIAKLHRATRSERFLGSRGKRIEPDYFAGEELIRDFHSGKRPLVLRWLGRKSALALCKGLARA